MKFVVIAAVVLVSVSLVGCAQPASLGSLSRAPDVRIPKRSPPNVQDCVHVPFPQCSGG
jgi:PBP1b-binding outer membrane lipoprotein LpoB